VNSIELRQTRANSWEQAKALHGRPEVEKRAWGAEDDVAWARLMTEIVTLGKQIERAEALEANANEELATRAAANGRQDAQDGQPDERRVAFRKFLRTGMPGLNGEEQRALAAGVDVSGGYLVPPQQFVNSLITAVDDQVFIRGLATRHVMDSAETLGVPSLDTDVSDATWTSELLIGTEDSSLAFGKRELKPNPLAKYIKISNKLIRQSSLDVERLVLSRLGYKFAVAGENAYLNGDGVGRPLGVFTASANGVSTSRDVSTSNTATAITADGLIEAKYTLKAAYWPKANWIFHRESVKMIAKLKDGEGQYLWKPGIIMNEPDRLLGFPYRVSEYAPHVFTAALYVGILGDFSFYWIVDALNMQIQRLVELYAATNQVGFIARLETDGMPVLAEAFVRVKLAAG
jgi:HK97 family phage major capsid protein